MNGDLTIGGAMTLYDNNAVATSPDIAFTASAVIAAEDDLFINMDSDNGSTNAKVVFGKNTGTNGA